MQMISKICDMFRNYRIVSNITLELRYKSCAKSTLGIIKMGSKGYVLTNALHNDNIIT